MDKINYIKEGESQLQNSNYYESIRTTRSAMTKNHVNIYFSHLYKYKYITLKEHRSLSVKKFNERYMYLLPKVHKDAWPFHNTPPGRPIISN